MDKDCNITNPISTDFCYEKSYSLLQKLKADKNYCLTDDDCAISFNDLKAATAEVDNPSDTVLITVENEAVTVDCPAVLGKELTNMGYLNPNFDNSFTTPAGTFTISVTLVRPSPSDIEIVKKQLQEQVALLAENFAVLSLNCVFGNKPFTQNCENIKSSSVSFSSKDSYTTDEFSLTTSLSFLDDIDDPSLNNVPYLKLAQNHIDEHFNQIKNYLDYISILNTYANLDCTVSNSVATATCPVVNLRNASVARALNTSTYSNSSRIEAEAYQEIFGGANYAVLLDGRNGKWKHKDGTLLVLEDFAGYKFSLNEVNNDLSKLIISDAIANTVDGTRNIKTIYNEVNEEANLAAIDALNCYFGNPEYEFYCCNALGKEGISCIQTFKEEYANNYTQIKANDILPTNKNDAEIEKEYKGLLDSFNLSYFVTNNNYTIDIDNKVKVEKDNYIVRADFSSSNSFSERINACIDAYLQSLELAKSAAAMTLTNCGYSSHEMFIFCDKGNKDPYSGGKGGYDYKENYKTTSEYYKFYQPNRDGTIGLINRTPGYYVRTVDYDTASNPEDLKKWWDSVGKYETENDWDVRGLDATDDRYYDDNPFDKTDFKNPRILLLIFRHNYKGIDESLDFYQDEVTAYNANNEIEPIKVYNANNEIVDMMALFKSPDQSDQKRFALSSIGVCVSNIPYSTYSSYYNHNTVKNQIDVDLFAVMQLATSISCMYGNAEVPEEPCTCSGNNKGTYLCPCAKGITADTEALLPARNVAQDAYNAATPEQADKFAITAHQASAICTCAVFTTQIDLTVKRAYGGTAVCNGGISYLTDVDVTSKSITVELIDENKNS